MRKYVFKQSTINIWNTLPVHVVNSCSVNSFKNNLDRFAVIKKCTITLDVILP